MFTKTTVSAQYFPYLPLDSPKNIPPEVHHPVTCTKLKLQLVMLQPFTYLTWTHTTRNQCDMMYLKFRYFQHTFLHSFRFTQCDTCVRRPWASTKTSMLVLFQLHLRLSAVVIMTVLYLLSQCCYYNGSPANIIVSIV